VQLANGGPKSAARENYSLKKEIPASKDSSTNLLSQDGAAHGEVF
jgi:hypothetical protein